LPHVDEDIWNPADVESDNSFTGIVPLFVSVTACDALVVPTPVVGKAIELG